MQIETYASYPELRGGHQGTGNWTDDRVATLKKLWLEGKSGGEIAKTLRGGVTRNAVIGKAHRLGLPKHGGSANYAGGRSAELKKARPRPVLATYNLPASESVDLPLEDVTHAKPIASRIFGRECAWPVADGMACCAPTVNRDSYCEHHKARASAGKVPKLRVGGLVDWGRNSGDPERWFG